MAVTQNSYIVGSASGGYGGSTAGPYPYSFPLIADTDVAVIVDGQARSLTTHYTHDSGNSRITFVSGQEPSSGSKVIVYRDTDEDPINATFNAGSTIRAVELNDNFKQVLYIAQETENQALSTLGGTMSVNLDMGIGTRINFEGATTNDYETTLTVVDPTADRTITLPNVTGTVITTGDTGTVNSTMITDGTIVDGDIANTTITGGKLVNNTITATQIAADAVTASELADNAVDRNAIVNDAVNGTKIADDSIDSEHIVDGSVDLAHLSADSVNGTKIADDSIDSEHIVDGSIDLAHMSANSVDSDQYVDGSIDSAHIGNDQIDSQHYAAGSIDLEHMSANSVDSDQYVDGSIDRVHLAADIVDGTKIADDAIGAEHIQANAVGTSEIADAELVTLAGMPSATASVLADSTALTSTTAELNLLDGKSIVTSISGSSTDVQLPTAKAVNDQILAITQASGGFYPIDDELKFPNANPDPNNDAGTIVSIADAGGIVVNSSGVSTTGRTLGGATVTINGIDSTLRNTTIAAGKGMLVQTTSTLNTYTYHRLIVDEAGVASAQTLVTDFNQRYQVAGSTPSNQPDGTALAEGDLWFDTAANTMKVYEGSQYNVVTSVGDYKLLTVVPDGATSGSPVFNGSNVSFDLRDGSNAASVTSVGQLIVSLNGVIQKPNAGSYSASEEGFYLEGTNGIKFCTAPAANSSIFVTLIGSATSVNVPATNSVVEAAIQSNVVSEAKLKISNSPTNGQFLQAQSGASGGLTWANAVSPTLTTQGDILYHNGSAEARLAAGTAGYYLKTNGSGQNPSWGEVQTTVADGCIYLNNQTISSNYTMPSGKNGMSAGPITISGSVTIPNGGSWSIV